MKNKEHDNADIEVKNLAKLEPLKKNHDFKKTKRKQDYQNHVKNVT